jgi:CRISPR-associated endonuclease Csn1
MSKTLGLDLGTNSIGWAVVEQLTNYDIENGLRTRKETFDLLDKGVRIFSEGVKIEKGNESSRAAERTAHRSARRLKFRRKLRKYETLKVLAEHNMCPLSLQEVISWRKSNFKDYPNNQDFLKWLRTDEKSDYNPYRLRKEAVEKEIGLFDLGRALYHISQRRGFKSNRLDNSDNSIIEDNQKDLLAVIQKAENQAELKRDLDEFFSSFDLKDKDQKPMASLNRAFQKIIKNSSLSNVEMAEQLEKRLLLKENLGKVKQEIANLTEAMEKGSFETIGQYFYHLYSKDKHNPNHKIRKNYTAREEHYENEFNRICEYQKLDASIINQLHRAIFYQRPLRSQKGSVGKCTLEKNKQRCPKSHPAFEKYRMLGVINNIRIKTADDESMRPLSVEERRAIMPKFYRKTKPTFEFKDLAKVLGIDHEYNYRMNQTISGNPTSAALALIFGEDWESMETTYHVVSKKGEKVMKKVNAEDLWHILFSFDSTEKLKAYAVEKLSLPNKEALAFANIRLKQEYASLSLKAINKILPWLERGLKNTEAIFMANLSEVVDDHIWNNDSARHEVETGIKRVIDNHGLINKKHNIINGLFRSFKDQYANNHRDYNLDPQDKKAIREKCQSVFGTTWLDKLSTEEQQALYEEIEALFEQQLRKDKFLPIKRLDDQVKDFLLGKNESGEIYCSNETKIEKLYHPSEIEVFKPAESNEAGFILLGDPAIPAIKNPMAMRTMYQLRTLINALIKAGKIDSDTKIHIELARNLNDANKRAAIQEWQKRLEKQRNENREKIIELYKEQCGKTINPSEDDLLRYQLWLEQDQKEIYEESGKQIGICDIIGPNPAYDIEHTLPRSISQDNSQTNKTLCSKKYNREIKKNQIPSELGNHDLILQRIVHWKTRFEKLEILIESKVRATKGTATKEQRDRIIQERHLLTFERDYWKGKHERFVKKEVKEGFKNSQLVDTGIITKYARAYLKSVFLKVYSIKGSVVDEFRKAWGLHDTIENELGQISYLPKDRSRHTHHCKDAITIACITKTKYDLLAHAWRLEEKEQFQAARKVLEKEKPWPTFAEDVRTIDQEVFVSHFLPNRLGVQTKKKLRKRGRIQRDRNGREIIQTGDTARGSLHKDTYYGQIKDPNADGALKRVIRKELAQLKSTDVAKIIDPVVREKVEAAVAEHGFKNVTTGKVPIWMNEEKKIPINKVRYEVKATSPIEIKKHKPLSLSKHAHKHYKLVVNDENYCMAIYEGEDKNGKLKRAYETIQNIDAAEYFKLSASDKRNSDSPAPLLHQKTGFPLKFVLEKGQMVLFYENDPAEIWELSHEGRNQRLYHLAKFDSQGRLVFRPHYEARPSTELKEEYKISYTAHQDQVRVTASNLTALIEGIDFTFNILGEIQQC